MTVLLESLSDVKSEVVALPPLDSLSLGRESCLVQIFPTGVRNSLIPVGLEPVTFGRSAQCTVELDDDFASRLHATLLVERGRFHLRDNGSLNGTFVNDDRIDSRVLEPGDRLRLGNHIFKFLSSDHIEVAYHEAVYQMMTVDALTEIYNRRYFEDAFRRELHRAQRHERSLALMLLDVDYFKQVNDKFGHLVGDEVLRGICQRIRPRIRGDEVFARIGGEEFAVLVVEITSLQAKNMAEQLRELIAAAPILTSVGPLEVRISLGLVHTTGFEPFSQAELQNRADQKLYEAKRHGRNCVKF